VNDEEESTSSTAARPVPFEAAIAELEQVVKGLESGDLSLDDAIDKFQRGMHLVKVCREQLQVAEQKVELVLSSERGLQTRDFDLENEA